MPFSAMTDMHYALIPLMFNNMAAIDYGSENGETCTISVGSTEEKIVVDNSSSGSFAMAGMFGGRGGGRRERFFDGQSGAGNTAIGNTLPGIPDGDVRDLPEIPGGQMPDMDGIAPSNGFQVPEGSHSMQGRTDIQCDPSGSEAVSGEIQPPGQNRGQNGMGGKWRDKGQFMQWERNQNGLQDTAASSIFTVSTDTLALVGVSILFLLVGILVALKVKP